MWIIRHLRNADPSARERPRTSLQHTWRFRLLLPIDEWNSSMKEEFYRFEHHLLSTSSTAISRFLSKRTRKNHWTKSEKNSIVNKRKLRRNICSTRSMRRVFVRRCVRQSCSSIRLARLSSSVSGLGFARSSPRLAFDDEPLVEREWWFIERVLKLTRPVLSPSLTLINLPSLPFHWHKTQTWLDFLPVPSKDKQRCSAGSNARERERERWNAINSRFNALNFSF